MAYSGKCFICEENVDINSVKKTVKQRGINSFIEKSHLYNDNKWSYLQTVNEVVVHENCRVAYCLGPRSKESLSANKPHTSTEFDASKYCIICEKPADSKNKLKFHQITSDVTKKKIIEAATDRDDELGRNIILRFHALPSDYDKIKYHSKCYKKLMYVPSESSVGRHSDSSIDTNMMNLFQFIESSDDSQFSLNELMQQLSDPKPDRRTVLKHLEQRYQDDIQTFSLPRKDTIVIYRGKSELQQ